MLSLSEVEMWRATSGRGHMWCVFWLFAKGFTGLFWLGIKVYGLDFIPYLAFRRCFLHQWSKKSPAKIMPQPREGCCDRFLDWISRVHNQFLQLVLEMLRSLVNVLLTGDSGNPIAYCNITTIKQPALLSDKFKPETRKSYQKQLSWLCAHFIGFRRHFELLKSPGSHANTAQEMMSIRIWCRIKHSFAPARWAMESAQR